MLYKCFDQIKFIALLRTLALAPFFTPKPKRTSLAGLPKAHKECKNDLDINNDKYKDLKEQVQKMDLTCGFRYGTF